MSLRSPRTPPFRRRFFTARRRRVNPLTRVAGLFIRILAAGAPLPLLVIWMLRSPAFALQELEVEGNQRVESGWLEKALARYRGRNLLALQLDDVQEHLQANPWVKDVALRKRLPRRLRVGIVEYEPSALLEREDGFLFLGGEGEIITPIDGEVGLEMLVVSYDDESRLHDPEVALAVALRLFRRLDRSEASWARDVARIEILSQEDYRILGPSLPCPVLVRGELEEWKVHMLEELLPEILERYRPLRAVDLRFSGRIVLKPAPPGRGLSL